MILVVAYCIYLFLICRSFGNLTTKFIEHYLIKEQSNYSLFEKTFLGVCILTFLFSLAHIFIRISWEINIMLLFISIIECVFYQKTFLQDINKIKNKFFGLNFFLLSFWAIIVGVILFCSTDAPVYLLDVGRYHLQSLLWSESYALVPGLANLHARFGNWSSWYYFHSFIDNFLLEDRSFHVPNSFFYILFITFLFFKTEDFFKKKENHLVIYYIFLCYLLYDFEFIRYFQISGLTPDLPASLAIIYFFTCLHKSFVIGKGGKAPLVYILLISALAVYFRINAAFLIFPLGFLFLQYFLIDRIFSIKYIIFGLVIIAPLLIRNIILTGWIIFPMSSIDLFNFDWETPTVLVDHISNCVRNPGIDEFYSKDFDPKNHNHVLSSERINAWFAFYKNSLGNGGYIWFPLLGGGVFLLSQFIKGRRDKKYELLVVSMLFVFLVWSIYSGAIYRYGYGYIVSAFIFPIAYFYERSDAFIKRFINIKYVGIFLLFVFTARTLIKNLPISIRESKLAYPLEVLKFLDKNDSILNLSKTPTSPYRTIEISTGKINIAECDYSYKYLGYNSSPARECTAEDRTIYEIGLWENSAYGFDVNVAKMNWKNPLPSVGGIYKGLEFRGESLEDGFRINTNQSNIEVSK